MAKLNWAISSEYGYNFDLIANTREDAIRKAEVIYLNETSWEEEYIGQLNEDGSPFIRSPIPTYTASKIKP